MKRDAGAALRALLFGAALSAPGVRAQSLYGVTWDKGTLYTIDENTAQVNKVGETNVPYLADIQMGTDGFLYGFTTGDVSQSFVYKIDPKTAAATKGAKLNGAGDGFVFEGAMSHLSGTKFWCAQAQDAGRAVFFQLDVSNGAVSDTVRLDGVFDINGWAPFKDEFLAMNRETGAADYVNLQDRTTSKFKDFPGDVGEVGGATLDGSYIFFATGGPDSVIKGSNSLYRLDVNEPADIVYMGTFNGISGYGFSGIAAPEPWSLLIAPLALAALRQRRVK